MPDELDEYVARKSSRPVSRGNDESWGEYLFGRDRGLTSLITDEEIPEDSGVIGRGVRYLKSNPYLAKPFDWVQGWEDLNTRGEQALEPYIGKTGAKIASFPSRVQKSGAEMFFGSPLDAASTVVSGGETLWPKVGAKVLAKAPAILEKGLPYVKGVGRVVGRGADALQSALMGGESLQSANRGDYGTAAMQAGGSVLSGWGAAGSPMPASWTDTLPAGRPEVDPTKAEDARQAYEALRKAEGNRPTLDQIIESTGRNPFKALSAREGAQRNVVRESYSRNAKPTVITDPKRLLGPADTDIIRPEGRGTGRGVMANVPVDDATGNVAPELVDYTNANLLERGTRDLNALGIPSGPATTAKYIQDPSFRLRVQEAVAQAKEGKGPDQIISHPSELALRPRRPSDLSQEAEDALRDKYSKLDYQVRNESGQLDGTYDLTDDERVKRISQLLTAEEVNQLQDIGRLNRDDAATHRLHQWGVDPQTPWTELNVGNRSIPYDSPAGGYVTQPAPVRPGTPPTMEPSTTLYKRTNNEIDELGSNSPTTTGYFPRTTHMADEDRFIDEFGGHLLRRELPADAKIFDITGRMSPEQVDEVDEYLTRKGKPLSEGNRRDLRSAAGDELNRTLTDLFTSSRGMPGELLEEYRALRSKRQAALDYGDEVGLTPAEDRRIEELGRMNMRYRSSTNPAEFRDFMKDKGYAATNYRGISSAEPGPEIGFAIVDPSNLPRTKTVAQGGTPPVVGRQVTRAGEELPGPQQRLMAPAPTMRPVVRSMDDVRQALIAKGIPNPSDEYVRELYKDPKRLDQLVPPESKMEGVSAEGRLVGVSPESGESKPLAGLLAEANPEDIRFRKYLEDRSNEFYKVIGKADEIGVKLDKAKGIVGDSEFGKIIDRVKSKQDGYFKRVAKGMGMSMETELERMGEGGKAVARLFKVAATDAPIRFNNYMKSIDRDLRKMKHADFEQVVDALEGKQVKLTPELENFRNRLEGVLKQSGGDMDSHGLLEKGIRANYFPHRYDGVPTEKLREAMRKANMSEDQITANLNEIQAHRELKVRGEYSRNDLNVPGYRKDKNVLIDHLRDTAKRVEHARVFGAKDTTDPTSQLSRFIRASENPERAKDIADRIIRGGKEVSPESRTAARAIRNYATAAHLSLASISQLGGAVPIAMRTDMKKTLSGLHKALREDPNNKFMTNVNYARDFATHWNDGAEGDKLYKAFGIQGVQNYMNKVAGQAGYAHAQSLFTALKQDPTNKLARKQLEDLTLTPITEVLKQPALTEHQLQRSMTRMAEISQGTIDAKNLPYHWVGNGARLIPQIFQRMAFQGSKAIKDGLMEGDYKNRMKKLGTLAVTGLVAGEVIGDVKEIPKTIAEVGANTVAQELGYTTENKDMFTTDWKNNEYLQNIGAQTDDDNDRFGYTRKMIGEISPDAAKDENVVRGIANLMASYASGMTGDMMFQVSEALNDRRPVNALASGFWAWDELNTVGEGIQDLAQGNWRDPTREVVRRLPFVGSGITREIDTDFQAGGGKRKGGGPTKVMKFSEMR